MHDAQTTSHDHRNLTLNLARPISESPISTLHGPHKRLVLWVQGCSVNCTDQCINPAALIEEDRYRIDIDQAIREVWNRLEGVDNVEGVTILGGEPSDQAEALAVFLSALRQQGLGVMLYSGYTWTKLQRRMQEDHALQSLLFEVDLLIDGPFIDKHYHSGLLWRGSSNQGIRCLSDRYEAQAIASSPVIRGIDIVLTPEGRLHLSGMHNPTITSDLEKTLERITQLS